MLTAVRKGKPANSAARIVVGLVTSALFVVVLFKIGWFRTDRKLLLMCACAFSWLVSTGWLVLGAWDGNEIRLSRDWCLETSSRQCEYAPYIGTVVVEVFLFLSGWVMSALFVVWIWKGDYLRQVGLCSGKPARWSQNDNSMATAVLAPSVAAPIAVPKPTAPPMSNTTNNNPFSAPSSNNPFDDDNDF